MKQKRRMAALLAALALAASITAIPALATEGDAPTIHTEMPQENTEGETVIPEEPVEEPSAEPEPTPEPPASSDSSSSSQDSGSSSEDQSSSSDDPWGGGGTVSETPGTSSEDPWEEDPWEEPTSSQEEPTEDPWDTTSSETEPETPIGGTTDNSAPSVATPQAIATPRPSLERPQVSLNNGSSSQEEEDSSPNYVTFARLNMRGNSLASTLFFAGVGCIAVGVLGIVTVLAFYIRGRRHYSSADGILEEIHEAEARQKPGQHPGMYAEQALRQPQPQPQPLPPQRPARQVPPGAIMPEDVSLYTEEFSLPPQEDSMESSQTPGEYEESYQAYRDDYPQDQYYEDDYYDDGTYGDEVYEDGNLSQPEEHYAPQPQQPSYPQQPQEPSDQEATRQFDTEEILREALRYYDDDK